MKLGSDRPQKLWPVLELFEASSATTGKLYISIAYSKRHRRGAVQPLKMLAENEVWKDRGLMKARREENVAHHSFLDDIARPFRRNIRQCW